MIGLEPKLWPVDTFREWIESDTFNEAFLSSYSTIMGDLSFHTGDLVRLVRLLLLQMVVAERIMVEELENDTTILLEPNAVKKTTSTRIQESRISVNWFFFAISQPKEQKLKNPFMGPKSIPLAHIQASIPYSVWAVGGGADLI